MLEEILLNIQKPGRYIGEEWNIPKKDFASSKVRFALCFPDLYEVGMSNLGLRILYGILNAHGLSSCERFFAPASDFQEALKAHSKELFSLETKTQLKAFDIAGFSLGYELNFTNVLLMLKLAGIPLLSAERDKSYPLVIGGGPAMMNPEPMHAFFDLFCIGEAEDAALELVEAYAALKDDYRSGKITKDELLLSFSRIEGVYAPSLYAVEYNEDGSLKEFKPRLKGAPPAIRKRFVQDLDKAYFPSDWLTPYLQVIHDRITLEVMRGCPNRCRFCQARTQYYPYRVRSAENVISLAKEAYLKSGYEEIALGGLSVSDYPGIEEALRVLVGAFKDKGVGVSLPSIKPKDLIGGLSTLIATIKKTGLTFAPEAGTERLRNILNKDFDVADFFSSLEQAYRAGYQRVKLYFMIGLPSEGTSDLEAIIDFAKTVSDLRRSTGSGPAQVNVSINTLIPKPHTSLQWLKMPCLDEIKEKHLLLRSRLKNRRIELNLHDPYTSILEAILCRGDRRLSRVILEAFNSGCSFDAWREHFSFQRWMDSFTKCGIDPQDYLKEKPRGSLLPWDFLDTGIDKGFLLSDVPPER